MPRIVSKCIGSPVSRPCRTANTVCGSFSMPGRASVTRRAMRSLPLRPVCLSNDRLPRGSRNTGAFPASSTILESNPFDMLLKSDCSFSSLLFSASLTIRASELSITSQRPAVRTVQTEWYFRPIRTANRTCRGGMQRGATTLYLPMTSAP